MVAVVVKVEPALSVVVRVTPPAPTAPVPLAVLFPASPVTVEVVVNPEEAMVTTVGLVPLPASVAVLRTDAPVTVAVVAEPAASVVVRTTTTPVAPVVSLLAAVPDGAEPATPKVVVNGPPVLSVPVLTTTVLVPADSVAVTVATLVLPEAKTAKQKNLVFIYTCSAHKSHTGTNTVAKRHDSLNVGRRARLIGAITDAIHEVGISAEA